MQDKLARVLASGLVGGIVMDIPDAILYMVGFSNHSHWHWASFATLGHHPRFLGEIVFGEVTNLIFTMLLAALFVFVFSRVVTNSDLILRGLAFATAVWFVINALAVMFKLPDFELTLGLAVSNLITAWIYGVAMVSSLRWLDSDSSLGY